ncbi:MAG: proline--tRNA ligase [Candidatus Lindowbacteria bacterium RIFCSPLOWO2_12_FULL_62_27]|nr:MAG: proline--tRNA ligase [Candidatus Lindowbacteria bacterium RIFCSPLOWO2_12_FULL_62_27]
MRASVLLAPTLKEVPREAEAVSHRLLLRAGFIRPLASGIYLFLPLGLRVLRKIETIVREEMDRAGAQELLLAALHPRELWEATGRWASYGDDMMKLRDRTGREFGLGPTHEEVITQLAAQEIHSYQDLPKALYQIQVKFRDEPRPRFGLLRCKEFIMKDCYSFHATREDAEKTYERMLAAYKTVFTRVGIRFIPVRADPGLIGGNLSHEFIMPAESGEDTLIHCPSCGHAASLEGAEGAAPSSSCPACHKEASLVRGMEIGHIFFLGTKYSAKLNAQFLDADGVRKPIEMGCYGIGVSRLISAVVESSHDDKGMIWPKSVAPYRVHLIVTTMDKPDVVAAAERAYADLSAALNGDCLIDDRDCRAGVKFHDADLLGIPVRLVFGRGVAEGNVELQERATGQSRSIPLKQAADEVKSLLA